MGLHTPSAPAVRQATRSTPMAYRGLAQGLVLLGSDLLSGLLGWALSNALLRVVELPTVKLLPACIWFAVWMIWRTYQGLYPGYGRSPQSELRLHTVSTVQVLLVQLAAALTLGRFVPSVASVVLEWLVILLLALPARYGVRALLVHMGNFGRRISIIGAGRTAELTITHLQRHPSYGLNPVVAYDDNPALHGSLICGVPVRGSIELALTEPQTEQALISIPGARAEVQRRLINGTYAAFAITWMIPDLIGVPNQALQHHNIGNMVSLELRNNLRSRRARLVKRSIDLVAALLGGLLISPLLLLIALAIRLDSPGAVVYRARRLGRDGQTFDCFKFRSMYCNAEEKLEALLDANSALRQEFEASHKLKADPRVTWVGDMLRKTSLDELPQLLNVVLGEMSLVGPRPIVQAEVVRYGEIYDAYKQVRPGMTGYWQVNGRSDTSYDERVAMDDFYVTNWTPWLDLAIMIQTVRVVVLGKGAY